MKQCTIYFEFFGRKMKYKLLAKSDEEAKELIKAKIKFFKIEKQPFKENLSDIFEQFNKIFT
jgi:hypothetical protein